MTSFEERVAQLKAAKTAAEPEKIVHDPDVIPEDPYKDAPERIDLKDHIDILDAYEKYGAPLRDGFRPTFRTGQRESIKVRCPMPGHLDIRPDAWISLDTQTVCCGPCGDLGLDLFDLAAIFYDYPFPQYKAKGNEEQFKELARRIAEDFGITIRRDITGAHVVSVAPVEDNFSGVAQDEPGADAEIDLTLPEPTILALVPPPIQVWPTLDFDALGIWGTFLGHWIRYAYELETTPEYSFLTGTLLLGFATGRDCILEDGYPGVRPNMLGCIVAPSGGGKTRSIEQFQYLLDQVLPDDDPSVPGVTQFVTPGSGETIIDYFAQATDSGEPIPVKGLIEFNEFSDMTGRSSRVGSTYEPTIMKFFDQHRPIGRGVVGRKVKAVDHHLSILTSTQPRMIRRYLTRDQVDSGFAGRWTFACGLPISPPAVLEHSIPPARLADKLEEIVRFYQGRKVHLSYTADARAKWSEFYDREIAPFKLDENTSSIYSRIDLHCKKHMEFFAINTLSDQITAAHVDSTIAYYPYLKRNLDFIQGHVGVGAIDSCADDITVYLRGCLTAKKKAPTPKQVYDAVKNRHGLGIIKQALELMEKMELLNMVRDERKAGARGPVSMRIYLHA